MNLRIKQFFNSTSNRISFAAFSFSAVAILLSGYSIYNSRSQLSQETISMIKKEFNVLEKSNKDQILLAKHLTKIGAKFYGADWCGFTKQQKVSFGKEGTKLLNYQNCGNPENSECDSIQAYPTWLINNKKIEGFINLEKLKEISNYSEK